MKVYLDNNVFNRPFDELSSPSIHLEAKSTLLIFALIDRGEITLINSSALEFENTKNPFFERRIWISSYLSKARVYQKINQSIKERAKEIEKLTIAAIDAIHLAVAEFAQADYFVTCDYDILKKYRGTLKVINPISFIEIYRIEKNNEN